MNQPMRINFVGQSLESVAELATKLAEEHPGAKASTVIRWFKPWIEIKCPEDVKAQGKGSGGAR